MMVSRVVVRMVLDMSQVGPHAFFSDLLVHLWSLLASHVHRMMVVSLIVVVGVSSPAVAMIWMRRLWDWVVVEAIIVVSAGVVRFVLYVTFVGP